MVHASDTVSSVVMEVDVVVSGTHEEGVGFGIGFGVMMARRPD